MTRVRGRMNNAFDPASDAEALDPATRELVEARSERLGPAYRLFYSDPVHVVRGLGTRLWDADGNEYLDAYNNVVSVGHAHPRVAAAVAEQMGTLCTHTRYLHEGILRYAGELLDDASAGRRGPRHVHLHGLRGQRPRAADRQVPHRPRRRDHHRRGLPRQLRADRGDLARRWARTRRSAPWVRQVRAPDSYRGGLAAALAATSRPIATCERHGNGVAAFIVDSRVQLRRHLHPPIDVLGAGRRRGARGRRPVHRRRGPVRLRPARRRPVGLPAPRRRPRHRHARQADGQRASRSPGSPSRREVVADFGARRPLLQHLRRQHRRHRRGAGGARRHPRRGRWSRTRAASARSCAPGSPRCGSATRS